MQLRQIARLDEWYRFEPALCSSPDCRRSCGAARAKPARSGRRAQHRRFRLRLSRLPARRSRPRAVARPKFLEAAQIRFQPGLNEDLAATSIWGTQQTNCSPARATTACSRCGTARGPASTVRAMRQARQRGRHLGARRRVRRGGRRSYLQVVVAAAPERICVRRRDDSGAQSRGREEIVEFGLHGFALSRFSGCWIGLKVTQETADATQTFARAEMRLIVTPEFDMPPGGFNIRWPDPPNDQEFRLQRHKLRAALAFARANGLNRTVIESRVPRFGIVTTGKAHLDALQALDDLGIDATARPRSASSCSKSV